MLKVSRKCIIYLFYGF